MARPLFCTRDSELVKTEGRDARDLALLERLDYADAYQKIVSQQVLPEIVARQLDGYHGAYLLRRELDDEIEFATVMIFDSLDHVRAFAGEDYETAYVPPAARAVLAHFNEKSAHYTTLLTREQTR
jgi:antibiotic biosynthesis monooxygenase (ABM) superfamily enzyme